MKTIYMASLGCAKNRVDAEVMLGKLCTDDFEIVSEPEKAELIIVNTCSFIGDAKKESIDTILELSDYKEKGNCRHLVVTGCLPQRYTEELEEVLPEVDLFVGTGEYQHIVKLIRQLEAHQLRQKTIASHLDFIHSEKDERLLTTGTHTAWLKISEGCDRFCTYCIIPSIRGRVRSRRVKSLVKEAEILAQQGVKELNLISQDFSLYGKDLNDKTNTASNLLRALEKVEGIEWIRILYCYPDDLEEEWIDIMANSKKICPYIDMPIQHFNNRILKKMNRKVTKKRVVQLVNLLREKIPNIIIRTSLIAGFPGETEEEFQDLLDGLKELQLDRVGIFAYSDEEGTASYRMKDKVDPKIVRRRQKKAYMLQERIQAKKNKSLVGQILSVLVEGVHPDSNMFLAGRTQGQAPDIDGLVIINDGKANVGDVVQVQITETAGIDLVGEIL